MLRIENWSHNVLVFSCVVNIIWAAVLTVSEMRQINRSIIHNETIIPWILSISSQSLQKQIIWYMEVVFILNTTTLLLYTYVLDFGVAQTNWLLNHHFHSTEKKDFFWMFISIQNKEGAQRIVSHIVRTLVLLMHLIPPCWHN